MIKHNGVGHDTERSVSCAEAKWDLDLLELCLHKSLSNKDALCVRREHTNAEHSVVVGLQEQLMPGRKMSF